MDTPQELFEQAVQQAAAQEKEGKEGKERGERKRKKKWGAEKVEALPLLEQQGGGQEGPQQEHQGEDDDASQRAGTPGEPVPKKRRSRWEAPPPPQAIISSTGLPIQLPQSLAHLIDINPESLELNRQLNMVGTGLAYVHSASFI